MKFKFDLATIFLLFILIVLIFGFALAIILGVVSRVRDTQANRYCKSLDYDYAKQVVDKFNCCNAEIEEGIGDDGYFYEEVYKCIAGGDYPIK